MSAPIDANREELLTAIKFLEDNINSKIIVKYIANKYNIEFDNSKSIKENGENLVDNLMQYTSSVNGFSENKIKTTKNEVETEPDFDVKKYMGKWYNAASIPQPFDRGTAWETADYKILDNKTVEVLNTAYNEDDSVRGKIVGKAEILKNGELYVSFPTGQPSFGNPSTKAPNYIVHNTDYKTYAIVGSHDFSNLYFLVRKRPIKMELYEVMKEYAYQLGYDTTLLQQKYNSII